MIKRVIINNYYVMLLAFLKKTVSVIFLFSTRAAFCLLRAPPNTITRYMIEEFHPFSAIIEFYYVSVQKCGLIGNVKRQS